MYSSSYLWQLEVYDIHTLHASESSLVLFGWDLRADNLPKRRCLRGKSRLIYRHRSHQQRHKRTSSTLYLNSTRLANDTQCQARFSVLARKHEFRIYYGRCSFPQENSRLEDMLPVSLPRVLVVLRSRLDCSMKPSPLLPWISSPAIRLTGCANDKTTTYLLLIHRDCVCFPDCPRRLSDLTSMPARRLRSLRILIWIRPRWDLYFPKTLTLPIYALTLRAQV